MPHGWESWNSYYLSLIGGERAGIWPALQRGVLRALSWPYGWVTRVRNWLYDRGWKRVHRAAVPVVSVGNLTLGGTGKTPCVEYLARLLLRQGLRIAILSRGYGIQPGSATAANDEGQLLKDRKSVV